MTNPISRYEGRSLDISDEARRQDIERRIAEDQALYESTGINTAFTEDDPLVPINSPHITYSLSDIDSLADSPNIRHPERSYNQEAYEAMLARIEEEEEVLREKERFIREKIAEEKQKNEDKAIEENNQKFKNPINGLVQEGEL
jgi:hypothetical protein